MTQYKTGTVAATNGSATITGAGTATTKATEASQSAAQAGVFRDQASQIWWATSGSGCQISKW